MINKVSLTYEFDTETGKVNNVISSVDEVQAKAKRAPAKPKNDPKEDGSTEPQVVREDNRLVFNGAAIKALDMEAGFRVYVEYQKANGNMIPVIGASEEGKGNKVTKAFTLPHRGKANVILAVYGDKFDLVEYEENSFKLVNVEGEVVQAAPAKPASKRPAKKEPEVTTPVDVALDTKEIADLTAGLEDDDELGEFDFKL